MKSHDVEWIAAVLEWCRICRPDLAGQVREIVARNDRVGDGLILLMAAGFDAGRYFQSVNPECPLGPIMPGGDWESVTAAVHKSRHEPVPGEGQPR